ncbi:N-acetylmuramoyl-L-alanine amidase [Flavobacterium sp. NG2]|uniref:N-acetylmuramoyl-L-alanine amidase family protein n=1 Tax=Flavobacterium sp. NG2 TaxID=3097547 RepID=UPI002A81FD68|nr:N-acetylmuramoyl-L-alanine amidase [Flavobacterium sp. NG2]WPR70806.1 N-acetylmuramoyl-L-alanine amidase [Flavobacterium sp. NG2]
MYTLNKIKVIFTFLVIISSFSSYSQSNIFKVTLDAGHGDHDFGAVYSGHVEKNIALAIVLKVGEMLEAYPKVEVTYTRKTDVFIDLVERANIANRANASVFVSIHCNASKNTSADGTETYVMGMNKIASNLEAAKKENAVITLEKDYKRKYEGFDPNSPETMIGMKLMQEEYLENSISLASKIENEFEKIGKKIRGGGVKQAPFMVLHKAYMPRVLIETGFISNPVEGKILDSEEGQREIARAITNAIIRYKNEYFGNGTESYEPAKTTPKVAEKPVAKDTSTPVKTTADTTKTSSVTSQGNNDTVFKVQITAISKKIALVPKNFKGLDRISVNYENDLYRYMYGETADYNEAKKLLDEAKSKGYEFAFITAFVGGKKVSVQDAIK